MKMTTIALPKELKLEISEFGNKGETFADILKRLVKSAEKRMFQDLLFDEEGCVPVKKALERAKAKWQ